MSKDMTRVIFGKPVALWRAFLWDGIKFGLVGLSSIAVYFVILFLLQPFVDSVALLAALSYIGSAVFNYFGQSKVTFNSDVRDYGALLRYVAMHGLCIVINSTGMHFMVTAWQNNLWLSQVCLTVIIAGTSFLLSYFWVYRTRART
jgi:putative flippase GtrA